MSNKTDTTVTLPLSEYESLKQATRKYDRDFEDAVRRRCDWVSRELLAHNAELIKVVEIYQARERPWWRSLWEIAHGR